jgi:hypothetical protein
MSVGYRVSGTGYREAGVVASGPTPDTRYPVPDTSYTFSGISVKPRRKVERHARSSAGTARRISG